MNLLSKIDSFGAIDAENDERLIDYFYHAKVIDELFEYKKSIVIGRKGSGKTAIYKYIQNAKKEKCSPLLFKDYPWKIHDRYKNTIVSERESYVNSWTFFFYIEIFKKIVELKNSVATTSKHHKAITGLKKWLTKNWGSIKFDHKEVMSPHKPKFSFSLSPQILGNSLGSISRNLVEKEDMGSTLTEYNRKFESITTGLLEDYKGEMILLFDELDLAYSPNDLDYKNRLIGLLLATYDFYNKYQNIKIFVFLRNDIFNILDFQDKNKIKDNLVSFLDWDSMSVESLLSLKRFVSNRIKSNINSNSDNFERNWNEIFDSNNIGKNQFKWNFMIDRTFVRPRDVIKFMNLSLQQAKARLENNPDTLDKIINEDIRAIRQKYSTYLFEELTDEITSKYPRYNEYMEILRDIHKVTFTREDFSTSLNKLKNKLSIIDDIDIIMERLYEFSIIGFYKAGGGGYGGSEYRFQYASDYQAFNSRSQKFRVHYGFKEYLELIE